MTKNGLLVLFLTLALMSCSKDSLDFTLTVNAIGNGSVAQENIDGKRTYRLTAEPDPNFRFLGWSGDLSGTANPVEITLDRNMAVTATFEVQDLLEVQVSQGGSFEKTLVSSNNGILVYELRAIPASGFEFVSWMDEDRVYYSGELTVQIDEETLILLDFADTASPFDYSQTPIVDLGDEVIWGLDIINNEHLIFTTKSGKIYTYDGNQASLVSSYYQDVVNPSGQGGLLDIALDPEFESNKQVYVTYSKRISGSNFSHLALDRFRYEAGQISGMETIFVTSTPSERNGHFGSRIAFSNDHIFISIGEGSPSQGGANSRYQNAQDLSIDWGKIHRLNFDGTVPTDNPFYSSENSSKSIYSYGHRNPQGLMFDPYTSSIISTEHGPKGGDELNRIQAGSNYGWPLVSYGINYNDSDISGRSHDGYEEPLFYWDPSIATSQLVLLKDKNHKAWFRNILVAGLKSKSLFRLSSQNGTWQQAERINLGFRVRSVAEGENGVFFVTGDNGAIVRFTPSE